jgi:autotransporter-associated beta strand protein
VSANTISGTNYTRTIGLSGSGSASINNQIFLGGNLTLDAATGNTITIGSNITNVGGIIKIGDGTLILSSAATNNYSGGTLVSAGTLQGSATSLQGNITNNSVVRFNGVGAGIFTGVISGNGSVAKAGAAITLSNVNTYTGGTTIEVESLIAGTNGALGTGRLTFSNAGTARLNLNGFTNTVTGLTVSGAGAKVIQNEGASGSAGRLIVDLASGTDSSDATTIIRDASTGSGGFGTVALTKNGAGTLDLSVINSGGVYSGGLTVNAGALAFGAATNAVGSGAITLGGGALRYTATGSTNRTLANTFSLTPATSSSINVADSTVALTISNVISGSGALTKTGAGTLALAGNGINTYNGLTTVSEGTLQLNKTAGTTAIAGDLSVASGATLLISASDQVAGTSAVTLSGGTIVRGAGVSEQFGTLDLTAASTINYGSGAAGTLQFGIYEGGLTPNAKLTVNNFALGNVLIFGNDLGAGGLGLIPATFSGTTFTSTLFDISGMDAGAFGGFRSSWNGSTFTITSVPEPSTVAAALGLTALLGWPVIRRRFGKSKI